MYRWGINSAVSRIMRESGVDISNRRFGPHAMRHSLASQLLANGVSLPVISESLGHKNTLSTMEYLRVDLPSLMKCALDVPLVNPAFTNRKEVSFMTKYKFSSVFAPYMQRFVEAKEAMGFSRKYFESSLKLFDIFSLKKSPDSFITSSLIDKWRQTLTNNSHKTICSKYSLIAQFARYMNNIGFHVMYLESLRTSTIHIHHTYSHTNKFFLFYHVRFSCCLRPWEYG